MKATKKIVCLTLAIIMAALVFVMPVNAASTIPLIMVNGIGSTPLYKNFETEDEALVFSADDAFVEELITDIGTAFVESAIAYGVNKKDFNKFNETFFPKVDKYLDAFGYTLDGVSRDATIGYKQNYKPMSEYTEEEKAVLSEFCYAYGEKYGEKYVYNFSYDWREDPITVAEELNDFIKIVRPGSGKVNVVALSMGSNITQCYLAKYGGAKFNNVVYAAPAWQGTSLLGNVVTNNLEIDIFAVENYLVQLANVSATTHITAFIMSFIASQEGLSHEYFGDINALFQNISPGTYQSFIRNFAGMPGIWSLVPHEDYEIGKKFIYEEHGVEINPDVEAKIDAYHKIQGNAEQIIKSAKKDGMKFSIVCGYNCQMIPLSTEYEMSDTVVDTKYMSAGATCAKYLQAHDDWDSIYTQKEKDGHNHISWDYKVDASTCAFPENTWFVKNMQHSYFNRDNGTIDIVMWLLGAKTQPNVRTDAENYPQFFLYNTYKKTTKPMPADGVLGDVDGSGAVDTKDARLALKIAAGQKKAKEAQLLLGDIDEDGEISTSDVSDILKLAAGIYC